MTSLHAEDAFLSYYQFDHDPCTPRVPGFKFFPAQRKSVLGQLHHLARYGQQLLIVSGPKGSGKTLLRQALVASSNKQAVQSLVLSGRESTTISAVLRKVAGGLGAAAATVDAILARAGQLAVTGQEVYLLIDDAGLLEDPALEILLSLAAGTAEGRLHVFLFAEAELAPRLGRLSEGEDSYYSIELQPYTDAETREYLSVRLEGAGQSLDLLTEEQLAEIHLHSGGWPGAINQSAREVMIDSMLADSSSQRESGFSVRLPKKHLLALVIVAVGVGAAWFMSSETVPVSMQSPVSLIAEPSQDAKDAQGETSAVEFTNGISLPPQVAQPLIREPLAQASGEDDGEQSAAVENSIMLAGTDSAVALSVTEERSTPSVPLPLPSTHADAPPVVTTTSASQQEPVAASQTVTTVAPVSPEPSSKPKSTVVAAIASPGAAWYRSQPGSRVALQILATRSEVSAKAFVAQNGSDYRYFMKMHQGAPLYVVTYGVFSSREAANAALKSMPAKIQAGKPWPKTFASIQQEIATGR